MPLDGKCKEIIGKRVCAKNVTTLFFAFHIILFSNSRRNWVHSHKATNVATLGKNMIGRKADKTAFSTKLIEIYLPNNGLHGIMENA